MKKQAFLGALLGILVAAPGCGGDEALSKGQYVSKLNAMCEDFAEREREIGEPQTPADLVEKGPRILEAFEQSIVDKVGDLEAPGEIAPQADRLVDLAGQQRDVLAGLIDAAKDSDFAGVRELAARNQSLNAQAESIARELGAEACTER